MAVRARAYLSAGVRRGLIGQVPQGARPAAALGEVARALAVDVRVHLRWSRCDARRHFRAVMRSLMRHADWETLHTRPGHALIAAEVGISTRTVCTMIDAAHELGYLSTTEVGTTERIRAGRTLGRDPHRGQGNRAQTYRLCVPLWTTEAAPDGHPGAGEDQAAAAVGETAGHSIRTRSFHPSRSGRSPETGRTPASRLRTPDGGCARARGQRREGEPDRRPTAGNETSSQTTGRTAHQARRRPVRRAQQHPAWRQRTAEVAAVWPALPAELSGRLADHEADRLASEIARQLTHRTPAELAERITRHWAYWRYKLAAGLVRSPVAVAFRIVRRDYACPDVRCEDGWQLDRGQACQACELTAREAAAARLNATQTTVYSVPGIVHPCQDTNGAQRPAEAPTPTPPPVREVLAALGIQRPAERAQSTADTPAEGGGRAEFRARLAALKRRSPCGFTR